MSGRSKNRPGKDSVWLTNAWQGRISWRDCPLRVSYDNHQAGRPMLLPRSLTVAILGLIAVLVSAQTQAAPAPSRINREQAAESIVPQDTPPAACHVTLPSDSTFVLPSSLPVGYGIRPDGSQFYFGSEKLWTILPSSGVWGGRGEGLQGNRSMLLTARKSPGIAQPRGFPGEILSHSPEKGWTVRLLVSQK